LFSVGAVLYEMGTGIQAFAGSSPAVVFDSILNRKPAPAARVNSSLPVDLNRSIDKALEKDRRFRYQHASDLRADLERLRRDLSSGRQIVSETPARVEGRQDESEVGGGSPKRALLRRFISRLGAI